MAAERNEGLKLEQHGVTEASRECSHRPRARTSSPRLSPGSSMRWVLLRSPPPRLPGGQLGAVRLRGRPGVALTLAPRRSTAARGGPPARVGRPGGAASWRFGAGAGRAGRRCGSSSFVVLRGEPAGRSARRGAVGGAPRRSAAPRGGPAVARRGCPAVSSTLQLLLRGGPAGSPARRAGAGGPSWRRRHRLCGGGSRSFAGCRVARPVLHRTVHAACW